MYIHVQVINYVDLCSGIINSDTLGSTGIY